MRPRISLLVVLTALLLLPAAVMAEEGESERPWTDTAELSFVLTTGNAETNNFGFSNQFVYNWSASNLSVDAAALRSSTRTRTLSNPDGDVDVDDKTNTTAEAYLLNVVYRRDITEKLYWYVGAAWARNTFAGIDARYKGLGGLGYKVFENEAQHFFVELGADYTEEKQVGGDDQSYAGARAYFDYLWQFSKTAKFESTLELLENLNENTDYRAIWINSVTASLTQKMALKATYALFYDNEPVVVDVAPDGGAPLGTRDARYEFDDVDTILSASLVINF